MISKTRALVGVGEANHRDATTADTIKIEIAILEKLLLLNNFLNILLLYFPLFSNPTILPQAIYHIH